MINQPKWKVVEYSRSQIIKAGKTIKKEEPDKDEYEKAIAVIDNWRVAHAFPLHIIYMHLRHMSDNDPTKIIVAERIKRLDSILKKLKREPTMSLWAMQDLGGCRFIVSSLDDVYNYSEQYEKSRKRHILKSTYDYIKNPKASGYRSLHRVYEYKSDHNETYNKNMLIEIQFRTHLQHIWATAVETMGLFTKEAIKSGQGSDDVKRFFALISSLFALEECQPVVPNTSNNMSDLVKEIKEIDKRNNYLNFLSGIKVAVNKSEYKNKKQGYYILILNYNTHRLNIKFFKSSEIEQANKIYNEIEATRAESKIDAVLVRVDSFSSLRSAYPNYFSDIGEFITKVQTYIN